jgi:hypothetical protein
MAITIVQQGANTTATSITLGSPVTIGNVIVAAGHRGGDNSFLTDSLQSPGFTQLAQASSYGDNSNSHVGIHAKVATGTGQTYFVLGSGGVQWRLYELAGADLANTEALTHSGSGTGGSISSQTQDLGAFGQLAGVAIMCEVDTRAYAGLESGNFTMSAGWTERFDNRSNPSDGNSHPWIGIGDGPAPIDPSWDFTQLQSSSGGGPGGAQYIGSWAGVAVLFFAPVPAKSYLAQIIG